MQQRHATFEEQHNERNLNKQLRQTTTSIQLNHEEKQDLNEHIQNVIEEKGFLNQQLQKPIVALQDNNEKERSETTTSRIYYVI